LIAIDGDYKTDQLILGSVSYNFI